MAMCLLIGHVSSGLPSVAAVRAGTAPSGVVSRAVGPDIRWRRYYMRCSVAACVLLTWHLSPRHCNSCPRPKTDCPFSDEIGPSRNLQGVPLQRRHGAPPLPGAAVGLRPSRPVASRPRAARRSVYQAGRRRTRPADSSLMADGRNEERPRKPRKSCCEARRAPARAPCTFFGKRRGKLAWNCSRSLVCGYKVQLPDSHHLEVSSSGATVKMPCETTLIVVRTVVQVVAVVACITTRYSTVKPCAHLPVSFNHVTRVREG